MTLLVISIIALFLGIVALPLASNRDFLLSFFDGFVLFAIGGLVLFELLPSSLARGGGWALLAAFVGLFIPIMFEYVFRGGSLGAAEGRKGWYFLLWGLAVLGLMAHVLVDGMALAAPGNGHNHGHGHAQGHLEMLALAVVLHRLPMGLAIGWMTIPRWGTRRAIEVASFVTLVTVGGYWVGSHAMAFVSLKTLSIFQALVAGSLLHVAMGHNPEDLLQRHPYQQRWAAAGGFAGLASLVLLHWSHAASHSAMIGDKMLHALWHLSLESAPALLLAFIGGGMMHAFLKPMSLRWLHSGSRLTQSAKGMAFGLPLPICSCGVVPLYQSLVRSGAPGAAAMAFLIATPELGIDAILISIPFLGGKLTVIRLVTAAIAALAVAWFVSRWMPAPKLPEARETTNQAPPLPAKERFRQGLRYGMTELVDHTMPWILLGLVIAAILSPLLPTQQISAISPLLQVPLMALLGLPVYVCASGTTPFVAVLLMKGLSPGAALAFLLTGPATNVTTFGILRGLHGRNVALLFGASMFAVTCMLGWGVNGLFAPIAIPKVAQAAHHQASWINLSCLLVVTLLIFGSLWRRGPRYLLGQIVSSYKTGGSSDSCEDDDCCDHDHKKEVTSSCCGDASCGSGVVEKHDHHAHDHDHKHEDSSGCDSENTGESSSCCDSKDNKTDDAGESCCSSKK